MQASWTVLSLTGLYMAVLGVISFAAKRYADSAKSFTSGGTTFPAVLIGFLLMSEFIGTTASVGTAQAAYSYGISGAWSLAVLGIGFVLYSMLLARRFKALGENTISGALSRIYGAKVKVATSVIMIFAIQIVAISVYTSGGAVLSSILGIDRTVAIVLTGIVAVLYVTVGGMRSVIYTNVLHALVKYLGIVIAFVFALNQVGGMGELQARLPEKMFEATTVGWPQIIAWFIAATGAIFSTQYVIQAISTVSDGAKAQRASLYSAVLLIGFSLLAAGVGMCAAVLSPKIPPLQAFPSVIARMDTVTAAFVVAGLAGSLFGTISAVSIGTATLLFKDFYQPLFKDRGDGRRSLMFVRVATVVVGLIPLPFAILAPDVLKVTFLAKALRATLAVLVLLLFYAPWFGTRLGALISILGSLVLTIGWFLLGDPFGIDNTYIAVAIPIVVMTVSHLLRGFTGEERPGHLPETVTGEETASGRALPLHSTPSRAG